MTPSRPLSLLWPGPAILSPGSQQKTGLTSRWGVTGEPLFYSDLPGSTTPFQAKLLLPRDSHPLAIFIDSGADANLMDEELAHQLGIGRVLLPSPVSVSSRDSDPSDHPGPCPLVRDFTMKPSNFTSCSHHASRSSWVFPGFIVIILI